MRKTCEGVSTAQVSCPDEILTCPDGKTCYVPGRKTEEMTAMRETLCLNGNDGCCNTDAHSTVRVFFLFITLEHRIERYKVYEPYMRARLGTAAHFCKVVVLKLSSGICGSPWNIRLAHSSQDTCTRWGVYQRVKPTSTS